MKVVQPATVVSPSTVLEDFHRKQVYNNEIQRITS